MDYNRVIFEANLPEVFTEHGQAEPQVHAIPSANATRERRLQVPAALLRPLFEEQGMRLPESLRISCGWPLGRRSGGQGRSLAIGQFVGSYEQ